MSKESSRAMWNPQRRAVVLMHEAALLFRCVWRLQVYTLVERNKGSEMLITANPGGGFTHLKVSRTTLPQHTDRTTLTLTAAH